MRTLLALALVAGLGAPALAAEHRVEMLTKGPDGGRNVFNPLVVRAEPGDTIVFVPVDKGHNSASMDDGVPDGGESWDGKINKEVSVTLDAEGVYIYKCTPHLAQGMIGAVVVGAPTNLDAVRGIKYRGKAKTVAETIFAEIEAGS